MDCNQKLKEYAIFTENAISEYLCNKNIPEELLEAMRYSTLAGGKRLRPALVLSTCEMLGGSAKEALPFACAIEMIHTYSLIHDDLPALDNDDYRRGRLTAHKKFGEDRAILAGDALLSYAFEIMADNARNENTCNAMRHIASACGATKMVAGQWVDVVNTKKQIDESTLEYIHKNKTAAMIVGAACAGAACAGADEKTLEQITKYASELGYTFQIVDDILDCTGSAEELGKDIGSDEANGKMTFVTLFGLEGAQHEAEKHTNEAKSAIAQFENNEFLLALADSMLARKK